MISTFIPRPASFQSFAHSSVFALLALASVHCGASAEIGDDNADESAAELRVASCVADAELATTSTGLDTPRRATLVCKERKKCGSEGHTCSQTENCCLDNQGRYLSCVTPPKECPRD